VGAVSDESIKQFSRFSETPDADTTSPMGPENSDLDELVPVPVMKVAKRSRGDMRALIMSKRVGAVPRTVPDDNVVGEHGDTGNASGKRKRSLPKSK
jgi:hypothetical protein